MPAFSRLAVLLILFGLLTACGGGGGGDDATTDNTTDDALSGTTVTMSHEATFDPVADAKPAAVGSVVSPFFGAKHDNAQIVFNSAGYGMAVWQTLASESEKAVYALYDPTTLSWSTEQTLFVVADIAPPESVISLAASNSGFAVSWQVDVYENSNWVEYNYAKVYTNGEWSEAMLLNYSTSSTLVTNPQVASNGTDFMFAWHEDSYIVTRRFTSLGLSVPMPAYYISTVYIQDMVLVSNGSGYAIKVEHGSSTSYSTRFMAVALNTGGDWTTSMTTEANVGSITYSVIAGNSSGYLLVWTQDGSVLHSAYDGSNWSASSVLADVDSKPYRLTAMGNDYLLSWIDLDESAINSLHVKEYSGAWASTIVPESMSTAIDSFDVVATNTGYAFALRSYDSVSYSLFLHTYNGGAAGTTTAVSTGPNHIYSPTVSFDGTDTWLTWEQHDGTGMQLVSAGYSGDTLTRSEFTLNSLSHGGGATTGKVATTAGGIKVAAWGQKYYDETGSQKRAVYAQVDDGSGVWSAPVLLQTYADVHDVVAVGESIVVLLDSNGLAAHQYVNGVWTLGLSSTGFVYAWDYAVSNDRLMLVYELNPGTLGGNIRARLFDNGAFSTSVSLVQTADTTGYDPVVAGNANGFLLVWDEYNSVIPSSATMSRFYDTTTGWEATSVAIDAYGANRNPQVSSNGTDFMVVWGHDSGGADEVSLYGSHCNASGVCGAVQNLESEADYVMDFALTSNGTGYALVYAGDLFLPKAVIHDGSSWGTATTIGSEVSPATVTLVNNGANYLAVWRTYDSNQALRSAYYTPAGGWGGEMSIATSSEDEVYFNVQLVPVGSQYVLAWLAHKPGNSSLMYNLYTNTWGGTSWNGEQQTNTGKFEVHAFGLDVVNNAGTLSWVQAHESLYDEAAPVLWESSL